MKTSNSDFWKLWVEGNGVDSSTLGGHESGPRRTIKATDRAGHGLPQGNQQADLRKRLFSAGKRVRPTLSFARVAASVRDDLNTEKQTVKRPNTTEIKEEPTLIARVPGRMSPV